MIACLLAAAVPLVPTVAAVSTASRAEAGGCPRAGFSPGSGIMWESDADLARDLDEMVSAGAAWIRLDFGWANMEPSKGTFDWSNTDRVLNAVASRGLKVVAILHITPSWARPATDTMFHPPADPADYANFASATVGRYSGKVKVWELWNEPNISAFWRPKPDPVAYTTLLKLAYTAIKKADPGATVMSAGLSPAVDAPDGSDVAPATFLRAMYQNGGKGSFDAVGVHPYSYPARPVQPSTEGYNTFHRLPIFYDVMVRNGDGDKKMWLTEFGSPTGTGISSVSEAEQGAMITDAFNAASQMPGVAGPLFVYSGRDAGTNPDDREDNFGVLRRDFSAKPARAAFQQAAAACVPRQPASLSVGDASVVEGTPATFTITRTGDSSGTSSVQYATASGTATAGADFVAVAPTTVTFAPGETSKTVTVTANGGVGAEPDETFSVKLSSPTGATISDDTGLGTIFNDDAPPSLSINDVAVAEGNAGTKTATFTITRSGVTTQGSAVQYATASGSATSGEDFGAVGATVVFFMPGETSKTLAVAVNGDTDAEPDETFTVKLFAPDAAVVSDDTGLGRIVNDDGPATFLSVNDLSVTEGTLVNSTAKFTITRSGDTAGSSSVRYATADGTAAAGSDYTSVGPDTVTFAPGETTKTVPVTIIGDVANEPNETVVLNLSSPVGAALIDGQGVATIVDDDLLLGVVGTPGPVTFMAITDASVTEGNSGSTTASFTVVRTGLVTGASSVQYATVPGTATAGSDFAAVGPTTVNFAAGETARTVTVAVNGDTILEPAETFSLKLSSPSGATIADDTGLATILDDDVLPTVGIGDASVTEGNSGTIAATFTITRSGVTAGASSVRLATTDGSATAGADFVGLGATTVNFAPGETTETVTVAVNGDLDVEGTETFSVKLSSPTGAVISDDTGLATIFDDDAYPTVAVSDVVAPKGGADAWAIFPVTRSGDTSRASSVTYSTSAGTATEGTDYVGVPPTTLTFAEQETLKIVTAKVKAQAGAGEWFSLDLSSPIGAAVADGQASARIVATSTSSTTDVTTLAIDDVTVTEGNLGTKVATFTISRSGASSGSSSVKWSTVDGTATTAGDYLAVPLTTVDFAPQETTKAVSVTVNGDTAVEADETFSVRLSSPVGATIADGSGLGRIMNDDSGSFSVSDATVTEGNSGTKQARFTISRSGAVAGPASVRWSTLDAQATAPGDYLAVPATTVDFGPGETTKAVSVTVNADTAVEADETYYVRLSAPVGASILDGSGLGRITNDDTASLAINDVTVTEGNSGTKLATFTISRSGAVGGPASIRWFTADGTTAAGSDYVAVGPTTVDFGPGETTKTVSVTINGDTAVEANEVFYIRLTAPVMATIGDGTGMGRITNDDSASFSVNDVAVTEGNSGTTSATFTITRSGAVAGPGSVQWYTIDGTGVAPGDYVRVAATTVDFAPGETQKTVSVSVNGDTTVEPNETFSVRLSAATGGTLVDPSGLGRINNDD